MDCIGLVLLALRECGVEIPDPAPYAREPQGHRLLSGIEQHARRVVEAEPGDVLLFRLGLYGGHVGIASEHAVSGGLGVIHAFARQGERVCEQAVNDEMVAALVGAFRLKV